jgi:hypothetical protein
VAFPRARDALLAAVVAQRAMQTHPLTGRCAGPLIDGMPNAVIGEIPVSARPDFTIYTGSDFTAQTMDPVWAKQTSAHAAIQALAKQWQADLDAG